MEIAVKRNDPIPYTAYMLKCELSLANTIMVMYRIGFHKDVWDTCSNVCAGWGLNEQQAREVVKRAELLAKRQMRA